MPSTHDPASIEPILAVEPEGPDLFQCRQNEPNTSGVLFGGQVLGQGLNAAMQTVQNRPVHSLHAYFLRRGRITPFVSYKVEATHEGRSFSTRRVTAVQAGVTLFHMECSFHASEPGFHHEEGPVLSPPDPDTLPSFRELAERYKDKLTPEAQQALQHHPPLEIKPIEPERLFHPAAKAVNGFWIRVPSAGDLSPGLQSCALAYASDAWLASAVCLRQGTTLDLKGVVIASLDHAMWFHAPVRTDAWLYHEMESPWSGGGRGLARGRFFDRDGRLIASTAQEVLIRRTAS